MARSHLKCAQRLLLYVDLLTERTHLRLCLRSCRVRARQAPFRHCEGAAGLVCVPTRSGHLLLQRSDALCLHIQVALPSRHRMACHEGSAWIGVSSMA